MLRAGVRIGNMAEVLLRLRVHPASVSRALERVQNDNFVAAAREHLEALGIPPLREGAHRALVNRIDTRVRSGDVREGLRALDHLRAEAIAQTPGKPAAREIDRVAQEHRLDILIQTVRRGSRGARVSAAGRLVAEAPSFLLGPARSYLYGKIRQGPETRLVQPVSEGP
jgi:hypothetical protein